MEPTEGMKSGIPVRLRPSAHTLTVWLVIAVIGSFDAASLRNAGIAVAAETVAPTLLGALGLVALSFIYTRLRPDKRIAALAHLGAATLAFSVAAGLLSYAVVTWHRPLIDASLAEADQALGLDWLGAYRWVMAHPRLNLVLRVAYWTLTSQMIVLLVVLNFLGRAGRCWEMLWLFMIACTGCALFSGVWPATGAFGFFHVQEDEPYVQVYRKLYDGALTVIGRDAMQGIIQFPSLHMAWAIIYTYAARGIRWLFPALLALNILVFFATPAVGGHHYADLWGGIALTLAAIFAVRKMQAKGFLPADA